MSAPEPKEVREAFQDYRSAWDDIREEAASDMRAISVQGPWSDEDRAAREDAGRPCVHLDQINQYLAQLKGNVRKNKRAIKATPKGNGANDQDAGRRSGLIMAIEEQSHAQPVYLNAFESMIERSYGFAVIRKEYRDNQSFDQDLIIKPIMNPDTVLLSPNYKQPDASDIPDAFLLELITKDTFKRLYPKAKITDFTDEQMDVPHATDWIKDKYVQRAEYWKIEYKRSKLLLVETAKGPIIFREDEWKEAAKRGMKGEIKRERSIEDPRVVQYMTNGLEILDEVEWEGSRIPIVSCLGPERWTTEGGNAKRTLLSMVRFARDPQMLFDYMATQECEEAGQIPKAPFVGYKGQFESDKETWETLTKIPHGFVQADVVIDGTNNQVLPLPVRPQWTPNFQQFEIAKDAATRAIQSGINISPMPDAAQRRNQKSGIALEKIDDMESLGSFIFVDRYENGFLHNMGWQINELITPVMDTEREMPLAEPDGKRSLIKIVGNTSHPIDKHGMYEVQDLPETHIHTGKGDFDVTISTGPSEDSEREEQGDFVDQLLENIPNLPMPGTPQAKILALAIRMRPTLGPIGKQIADVFDPPQENNLPPEAQMIVQQLQAQNQQLQQENAALHLERAGKVLELQNKQTIESMKGKHMLDKATMDFITQVIKAELAANSKASADQASADADKELAVLGFNQDHIERGHQAGHEAGMQAVEHAHEHSTLDKQTALAQTQQATQIAADQAAQETQP